MEHLKFKAHSLDKVKMRSMIQLLLFVLFGCGITSSAPCKKFRIKQVGVTYDALEIYYRLGVIEEIGTLTVKYGSSATISSRQATFVKSGDNSVGNGPTIFEFKLNDEGKLGLKKERCIPFNYTYVLIGVAFIEQDTPPFPKIVQMSNGGFECDVPDFLPPDVRICKQILPEMACSDMVTVKNDEGKRQSGYITLNATKLRHQEIAIGLSSPVNTFAFYGCGQFWKSDECKTIFHVTKISRNLRRKNYVRLYYKMKVKGDATKPTITYVSYGNRLCRTSCGMKPLCPVTTAKPTTTTVNQAQPPASEEALDEGEENNLDIDVNENLF